MAPFGISGLVSRWSLLVTAACSEGEHQCECVWVCVGVHGCAVGPGAPHGHILPLCPLPGAMRGQLQRRVLAGGALILAPSPPPPPPRSLTLFSLSLYIFLFFFFSSGPFIFAELNP